MSGFFSLGGGGHHKDHQEQQQHQQDHHHHHPTTENNNSLFLFKNEEIYNKGFELWQQYYQLHQQQRQTHHHHHHHHTSVQDVDFSVGPSRNNINNNNNNNNISIDDDGDDDDDDEFRVMSGHQRQGRISGGGGEGVNCQDCGNQAKKDCPHMRCRTCCKSRGFHCQTHVKSTWVPAAKRRERLLQLDRADSLKRLRENPHAASAAALACSSSRLPAATTTTTTTSGFELGHFPAEVTSPAVFRCVRVSAVDHADEHLAYQTAVSIGGHVFKGIVYDQGPEGRYGGEDSSSGVRGPGSQHQPLDLIAAGGHNQNMTTTMVVDPSSSSIYPTPLNAFMAGTQFFPPPRP